MSARSNYYEFCSSNGQVRVKMLAETERRLKPHDGKYQFKVLSMLYADFGSILKPVDGKYRKKLNQMKPKRNGKTYKRVTLLILVL